MSQDLRIRSLTVDDSDSAVAVIDVAAEWYREFLSPEEVHGPEMTVDEWRAEAARMTWYGAFYGGELVGVMGLENVGNVALFRHAYVTPHYQQQGIASRLHEHLESQIHQVDRIIIGTYAANYKARSALEKAGYRLSADPEEVLRTYYDIPEDRLMSSVTYEKTVNV